MDTSHPPVALITGSGRERVGNVIARDLAKRGYQIALHYHSSGEAAEDTCQSLRDEGTHCEAFQADVSSEDDIQKMVKEVIARFDRIDTLITTSSIWSTQPLDEMQADDLRKNFDVNTLGTVLTATAVGRIMVKQPEGGSIITIGDWAIERPYLDHLAYFVSKGAIPAATRCLALELGHRNPRVRVNCIHPGPVMFPPGTSDEEAQQLRSSTLVKNGDCPEMVAHAVRFLIENHFVTGVCIPVDGGRHMYSPEDAIRKSV